MKYGECFLLVKKLLLNIFLVLSILKGGETKNLTLTVCGDFLGTNMLYKFSGFHGR